VASEGSFVTLGSWPGTAPGPDRPWLVSTKDSAFLAGYDRSGVSTESVLLRVAEDSLERGALCWQAANASFEVVHFTGRTGQALAMPRRPDVTRQWIKLWGDAHMQNVTGPIWPRGAAVSSPSVRFYDRLQSGKVVPADLELDRGYHPGRPRMNLGADLTRLHVKVRKRDRR
jgi:serine/threonine-protein kinase